MFKLSVSLLLSAVCALFLLGAVLDILANDDSEVPAQQMQLYRALIETLSAEAEHQSAENLRVMLEQQQKQWQVDVAFIPRDSVALPVELAQQLTVSGGLSLANSEGTFYLKALKNHPTLLLQLNIPQPVGHKPEDLWLTLALYGGLCLIMLLWLAPLARRLWLLSRTAEQFGAGNFQARLPLSQWSYISSLEHSFNQMAQQIEQLMADNRLLASSLSHDLRTPIACFRFGLEAAIDETDPRQKNTYLQRLEQDVDRMEAMVNAFLEYASLDRQHQHWVETTVDLVAICQQVRQSCLPLAQQRSLSIELTVHDISPVTGHAHWLSRVMLNLLQNACRYAKSKVDIELWQQGEKICIRVRDDGDGIAEDDAVRIFQPFVRLETQSSQQPQFGLGLAIVRKVLDWHLAEIVLERKAPLGASFVIRLPINSADNT